MNKLIIIGGPTASGKTNLAIEIAKKINGEIINADSVQVYKYLNIGSNKGNFEYIGEEIINNRTIPIINLELSGIEGHLFDIVKPDEDFDVFLYQKYAFEVIQNLWNKKTIPIIIGGTGLYIDAILKGYQMTSTGKSEIRDELNKLNLEDLQKKVFKLNANIFKKLNNSDKNNPRRLIRLIEKYHTPKSSENNIHLDNFEYIFFYPKFEKEKLFEKIETRMDEMVKEGLIEEVQSLLEQGYSLSHKSMQSHQYKPVSEMLLGISPMNINECKKKMIQDQKKYVKRQITWFEGKRRGYQLRKVSSPDDAFKIIKNENFYLFS